MSGLCGIWGQPYIDLKAHIDTTCFAELHEEIVFALSRVEVSYTGGSLKWMNVVAPWVQSDPYVDYGHVIEGFSKDEFVKFVSLAPDSAIFDVERRAEYRFGDETDHPLSREQMLYLKYKYGVYFPWKACYHLVENDRWEDKHSGAGKGFSEEALRELPQTVAFIRRLPFREIGRCVIFGVEANDHAPLHRDSEPGQALQIAQSISFDPRGNKRFVLSGRDGGSVTPVETSIYWFNDMDYHGVLADPFFRYSVRVDGVFDPSFVARLLELESRTSAGALTA
jgi:hypothetical protein